MRPSALLCNTLHPLQRRRAHVSALLHVGTCYRLSSGAIHRRQHLPRLRQALVRLHALNAKCFYHLNGFVVCFLRRFAFVQPDRSSLWCIVSYLVGGAPADESLKDCISYNLKVTLHSLRCGMRKWSRDSNSACSLGAHQLAVQKQPPP
jgi:hypothetical protein